MRAARAIPKKERVDSRKGLSSIERLCADKGLRLTAQRRIVARALSASHDYPSVEELHRRARKIDPQIALSTIYRIVQVLCARGIVEKHAFGFGRARLELVPNKHHYHLIDIQSGRVIEFRSNEIECLVAQIADRLGYRILERRLELYGVALGGDQGS